VTVTTWVAVFCAGPAVAVVAMAVTALVARRVGRVNVVDVTWGLALTGIAVTSALLGEGNHRWLVLALVAVWGTRLSAYMLVRSRGSGEDPRYVEMLGAPVNQGGFRRAITRVFVMQGAAVCLVALPVMVAALVEEPLTWLALTGAAIWVVGLVFEAVGDAQLAAYKRDPDQGPVLDRGLWAWTRHPNYFGDACIWWGIWLVAVDATPWALLTLPAPVTMTYFLAYATGARLLETTMMQRPGYPEYAARTPMFVPRPPR